MYARVGERKKKKSYKYIFTSIFVILLSFTITVGIIRWQTIKSEEQGNKIVSAVENYLSVNKKYPALLKDLSPQFIESIPDSYMGYCNIEFDYNLNKDSSNYTLSFPNAAIFTTIYNSEIREWKTQ